MRIGILEIGRWHAGGYAQGDRQLGEEIVAASDRNEETAQRKAEDIGCRASHELHRLDVEDYASVVMTSSAGAVGTIEVA